LVASINHQESESFSRGEQLQDVITLSSKD